MRKEILQTDSAGSGRTPKPRLDILAYRDRVNNKNLSCFPAGGRSGIDSPVPDPDRDQAARRKVARRWMI